MSFLHESSPHSPTNLDPEPPEPMPEEGTNFATNYPISRGRGSTHSNSSLLKREFLNFPPHVSPPSFQISLKAITIQRETLEERSALQQIFSNEDFQTFSSYIPSFLSNLTENYDNLERNSRGGYAPTRTFLLKRGFSNFSPHISALSPQISLRIRMISEEMPEEERRRFPK